MTRWGSGCAATTFRILAVFEFETVEAEFDTFDELAIRVLSDAMHRADLE